MTEISIIIPTLNASKYLPKIFLKLQGLLESTKYEFIIIDSSSSDDTVKIAKSFGAETIIISKEEFNHGGTRNLAASKAKGDILVYLTQDALPVSETAIINIIKPLLENRSIGMAYGRQIPYPETSIFGEFARLFNYPEKSQIKSLKDKDKLGIKTIFASNSFAAYRKSVLNEVGGFPTNVILGEDMYVAGKMILSGYNIAYVADAKVYHSHNYSLIEEFKRYFDIGVFHKNEEWILKNFAKVEGEGIRYIKAEINYLLKKKKYHLLPNLVLRTFMKYTGYKLGMMEQKIPLSIKKRLSMHSFYW